MVDSMDMEGFHVMLLQWQMVCNSFPPSPLHWDKEFFLLFQPLPHLQHLSSCSKHMVELNWPVLNLTHTADQVQQGTPKATLPITPNVPSMPGSMYVLASLTPGTKNLRLSSWGSDKPLEHMQPYEFEVISHWPVKAETEKQEGQNPGWYGKGCRSNYGRKRNRLTS